MPFCRSVRHVIAGNSANIVVVSLPLEDDMLSASLSWLILLIAGLFEVGWAIGLKYTEGFTRLWPSVGTVACMTLSVLLLGLAMKTLPVGSAYAVWVGVGAVGTVILGIILLGEPASLARLVSVSFIIVGIIGLKLAS